MRALLLLPICALAAAASTALAGPLTHDLFKRPPLESLKPAQAESVKTVTPAPPPEWKPELRAIIAGNGTALVNVEGRIVQMGQEIDGYKLVEVQERRVTFVRDKVRYTLVLNAFKSGDAAAPAKAPEPAAASPSAGIGTVKAADVVSKPPAAEPPRAADDGKTNERRGG